MGHLRVDSVRTRFDRTPARWLLFGGQVGRQCNTWAHRDDIIAFVGEGAGQGIAVACWNPGLSEMELNVKKAFGESVEPEFVTDFTKRSTHFEHPAVAGAVLHEAMHARHTRWDLRDMNKLKSQLKTHAVGQVVELLEETRIETYGVEEWPANRAFLRASALKLSLTDLDEIDDKYKAAPPMQLTQLMLLSLARIDAGVLDPDDVRKIRDIMVDVFGEDLLAKLRKIWIEAQAHRVDDNMKPLKKLAERWVKLLEDAGHKTEPEVVRMPGGPSDEKEESEGGEKTPAEQAVADATKEFEEAAEATEIAAGNEVADQEEIERDEAKAKEAAAASREEKDAKDASSKVFSASTAETDAKKTKSKLVQQREPTIEERRAAVALAKELERARYRERYIVKRRSALPPGRLNGRGAILADAQRSRGQLVTAEPWSARRRFQTEDPRLRMGIMVDISGSMSPAMEAMGTTAWTLSEAGRRVQAICASVYYGDSVFPVLRPGEHLDKVKIYSARDSTERFNLAFKALNGKLDLLTSDGARLLVIVSDMIYTPVEVPHLQRWLRRCAESGVAVVSVPVTRRDQVDVHTRGLPVEVVDSTMDPVVVATRIGQAAVRELTRVGVGARA